MELIPLKSDPPGRFKGIPSTWLQKLNASTCIRTVHPGPPDIPLRWLIHDFHGKLLSSRLGTYFYSFVLTHTWLFSIDHSWEQFRKNSCSDEVFHNIVCPNISSPDFSHRCHLLSCLCLVSQCKTPISSLRLHKIYSTTQTVGNKMNRISLRTHCVILLI